MSRPSPKIIIDLGDARRRKLLEGLAREKEMTLQHMLLVALREWLERQEQKEDLQAIKEVEDEPVRPIEELLAELGESNSP